MRSAQSIAMAIALSLAAAIVAAQAAARRLRQPVVAAVRDRGGGGKAAVQVHRRAA